MTDGVGLAEPEDERAAGEEPTEFGEKRVSYAEAFFDLVFVLCVTQISGLLHGEHDWAGVGRALIVFIPVFWCWVGTSVLANTRDTDNPRGRIGIFAVGLCGLFLALALPQAYGPRGLLFGGAYLAARWLLGGQIAAAGGVLVGPMGMGALVTGPLMLTGGFVHGHARLTLWAVAAGLDLLTPVLARRQLLAVRFHPTHLPERFALFLLIALGEAIVSIGGPVAAGPTLRADEVLAVAVGFVAACGLWWVYFGYAADAMRHAMTTSRVPTDIVRQVLSYGHLAFVGGVIAFAAGVSAAATHPDERLPTGALALLFGGCVLFLATFGYTRWRMFRKMAWPRLISAGAVLLVAPLCARLPALGALGALAGALLLLNAVEYWRVERSPRHEV
ncbi:low temperature requirement protein A [Streptacidiphilus rugosus]|uniref:low temperature requirement protein A n=1 Tax=Streptacidiphilus rugosus TaxID=405783 RepID=UPI00069201D1|nr:low temperature requirement protein A [Streptacidiphilus rugosus]